MSALSSVGKKKFAVYLFLLLLDAAVIALSARVNIFQEFFFMADIFPLALSIATLVVFLAMLLLDFSLRNSLTARPPFEIGMLYILSAFWLAFNAFSTIRWRNIPMNCSSIPDEFTDERVWCKDVQALKSLVWVLFVALFFTASFILRYAIIHHYKGNRHIWKEPLSRFNPRATMVLTNHPAFNNNGPPTPTMPDYFGRSDNFNNWEQFGNTEKIS